MDDNIKLAFLGGLFPNEEMANDIYRYSASGVQNAANALQWMIVHGLEENLGHPISIINAVFVGSYPGLYKKIAIPKFSFIHNSLQVEKDINCGFLNIWGVKQLFRYKAVKKALTSWAKQNDGDKAVLVYSMHAPFLKAVSSIKKKYKLKMILVCPDLPEYMNLGKHTSVLFNVLKSLDQKLIYSLLKYVDGFVVLTEAMNHKVNPLCKPYIVIEGMVQPSSIPCSSQEPDEEFITLMYSGTLHERYGIKHLIKAFSMCSSPNLKLVLCGDGDYQDSIIQYAKKDSRVRYLGSLSREKVLEYQRAADILINPRQGVEEFTKFSFPSKNMEYLCAGKPVIAYELAGIPNEYKDYFIYVNGNRAQDLADAIEDTIRLGKQKRLEIGLKNKAFVSNEKSAVMQTRKIIHIVQILFN